MVDGKDDEDNVRVVVRQRPQPIKVLLAGRIPQGEFYELVVVLDVGDKVLSRQERRLGELWADSQGLVGSGETNLEDGRHVVLSDRDSVSFRKVFKMRRRLLTTGNRLWAYLERRRSVSRIKPAWEQEEVERTR